MSLWIHFIYSFFATVGFAIVFNVPKSSLVYGGFSGAVGWTLFTTLTSVQVNTAFANLASAVCVALLGEIFARIEKKPVTAFVIPGIIPLVPGYGMYSTMLILLQNDFETGMQMGISTIFNSGAIAMGIILVSSLARIFKIKKENKVSS